jgi:tRNA A-37 threonylcarbamoyl transferase component Bud32
MTPSVIKAERIIKLFLNIPDHDIKCEHIRDNVDGSAIIKCAYKDITYIVKLFNDVNFGKNEITWFKLASSLGIGPHVYQADLSFTYIIIEYIKGQSLTHEKARDPFVLKEIAHNLKLLHASFLVGVHTREIFPQIYSKYEKLKTGGELHTLLSNFLNYTKSIEQKVQSAQVPLVPCHNDLNPGNIFIKDDKVIFIDWGDAAIANPYYDIVIFFVLNDVSKPQQIFFLEQYDKKLLEPYWQEYVTLLKRLVYFEFALNLLIGVQARKPELLFVHHIPETQPLEYYLKWFSTFTDFVVDFFYGMAIASLLTLKKDLESD